MGHIYLHLQRAREARKQLERCRDLDQELDAKQRAVLEKTLEQAQRLIAAEEERMKAGAQPPTPGVRGLMQGAPAPQLGRAVAASPRPPKSTPLYQRWWFWGALGVVAAG